MCWLIVLLFLVRPCEGVFEAFVLLELFIMGLVNACWCNDFKDAVDKTDWKDWVLDLLKSFLVKDKLLGDSTTSLSFILLVVESDGLSVIELIASSSAGFAVFSKFALIVKFVEVVALLLVVVVIVLLLLVFSIVLIDVVVDILLIKWSKLRAITNIT